MIRLFSKVFLINNKKKIVRVDEVEMKKKKKSKRKKE
jgi:hypothetical protein